MPQMMILLQFLGQIHHARRVELLPKALNILGSQAVAILDDRLIKVGIVHNIQCFGDKSTHLVIDIIVN